MDFVQNYLTPQTVTTALICTTTIYAILRSVWYPLRSLPLPPGPPVVNWISGHLTVLPTTKPWEVYTKWAQKYGPVIHLRVYGQHTIILSSLEDCIEVFERRSNLYSDRPTITMVDLMGWNFAASLMPYGPRWREQRRLFQKGFKRVASSAYRPEQTRKVNDLLFGLLTSPEAFREHTRTVTAAISMSIAYGYDIKPKNDYFVRLAEDAVAGIVFALIPGAALVNALPLLRYLPPWFPGAGFHKIASETKDMTTKMQEVPFKWVENNMPDCIVSKGLSSCKTDQDIASLKAYAAAIYAGGADTTATALETFFYAMTLFPDAQKKAQQELDDIVGSKRLPNYDDWDSLPYTEALFREVLRWRPVLPLSVAHAITQDDVLKNHLIPQGSFIFANIWAISRDESRYEDPEAFNPDRFFNKDGELINDDSDYVFGFGRRLCPGRYMARSTLWLSMITTLWAFNIAKPKDASGNEIPINVEYTDGLISHPSRHLCSITPRFPETGQIIREAVARTRARN